MVYQAVRGPTEGNDGAAVSSDPQVWIAQVLKRASEPLNEITEATSPAKRDQLIGKALVLFFEGIRDDHVSGFTTSNGLARLGFRVNSAVDGDGNRRYSVHFADARRLGPERAAELEHAEVLSIDGQPYAEYVEGRLAGGVPEFISKIDTERVQADGFSTFRVGAFGEEVPKGTVKFEFKLRDGRTVTRDLQWITRDNETPGPGVRPTSGTASGLAPMANTALRELVPRGALNFSPRSPCRGRSISDRKCAALIRRADQAQIPNSDAVGLRNIIAQRKGFTMMNQKQAL
ncbi:MAG: PDZ domain-containing protein, partial [Myxococcota bacterium]